MPVLPDPRRSSRQCVETARRRGLSVRAARRRVSALVGASRVQHAAPDRHAVAGIARRPALLLDRPHGDGRRRLVRRNARGARHRHRLRRRACGPADLHPRWIRDRVRTPQRRSASPAVSAIAPNAPRARRCRSAASFFPTISGGSAFRSDFRPTEPLNGLSRDAPTSDFNGTDTVGGSKIPAALHGTRTWQDGRSSCCPHRKRSASTRERVTSWRSACGASGCGLVEPRGTVVCPRQVARHFQTGQQLDIARDTAGRRRGNALPPVDTDKLRPAC